MHAGRKPKKNESSEARNEWAADVRPASAASLFSPMDNELLRVWQLIHELSDQLAHNQKIANALQNQAGSLKVRTVSQSEHMHGLMTMAYCRTRPHTPVQVSRFDASIQTFPRVRFTMLCIFRGH